ncbi:MAG: discoidin domain-containing protein [Deltaproteobacteria bacterium]|nr:discoidin domain-containing protein [Deltaproteobacteria bacterium]
MVRLWPIQILPFNSDQAIVGLMTRHILQGEFPWLYYGDSYGGILEPVLAASAGLLLGVSRWSLNGVPFLFCIFFIISIYYLGRELYGREIGLVSMLLAAIPPFAIHIETSLAIGGYIEGLCLGNLILLVTYRLTAPNVRPSLPLARLFSLGVLWGIAWWTYPISLVYLITSFCFLTFQKRAFVLKGRAFLAVAGFFLGSLPFWIWNLKYSLSFFTFVQSEGKGSLWANTLVLFNQLPKLFGFIPALPATWPAYFFAFLFLASLVFLLVSHRWQKIRFPAGRGRVLLLFYFVFFVLLYSISGFGERTVALRYLVPFYSLFPITLGLFFYWLKTKNRFLGISLMVSFLLFFSFENLSSFTKLSEGAIKNRKQAEVETALFQYLKEKKIRTVYTPEYWSAARLTFEAQEAFIFSLPFNDRYPLYTLLADASSGPAFVLEGEYLKSFEEMFRVTGGTYKKEIIARYPGIKGYSVYYDFKPPATPSQEILPDGWKGESSFNPGTVQSAFDRNISTSWAPSVPQKKGTYYQLDLGRTYPLNRIVLLTGKGKERDFPKNYRVEVSRDLKAFQEVAFIRNQWAYLFWSLDRPFWKLRDGRIEIRFEPKEARYVKITLMGEKPDNWAMGEIFIYQKVDRPSPESPPPEELLSFLSKEKIGRIYTDIGLSARITKETQGKIKSLQDDYLMTNTRDYAINGFQDTYPFFNDLKKRIDFSKAPAFVVGRENNEAFIQAVQKMKGITFQVKVLKDYFIYHHFKAPEVSILSGAKGSPVSLYWTGTHLLQVDPLPGARDEE